MYIDDYKSRGDARDGVTIFLFVHQSVETTLFVRLKRRREDCLRIRHSLPLPVAATVRLFVSILCILFFASRTLHRCCRYVKEQNQYYEFTSFLRTSDLTRSTVRTITGRCCHRRRSS